MFLPPNRSSAAVVCEIRDSSVVDKCSSPARPVPPTRMVGFAASDVSNTTRLAPATMVPNRSTSAASTTMPASEPVEPKGAESTCNVNTMNKGDDVNQKRSSSLYASMKINRYRMENII